MNLLFKNHRAQDAHQQTVKIYAAYGSNLNKQQMTMRCPDAKYVGTGTLNGYELCFKGMPDNAYATVVPAEGASVPIGLWEISERDEQSLDRYEGFPRSYFKQSVSVQTETGEVEAIVYIMNLKRKAGIPSPYYYRRVYDGYRDCGLDASVLDAALKKSVSAFYEDVIRNPGYSPCGGFFGNGDKI